MKSSSWTMLPRWSSLQPKAVGRSGAGPTKPIAMRTRSAGSVFSVPGSSRISGRAAGRVDPLDLDRLDGLEPAVRVADEAARVDEVAARIGAPQGGGLFLAVVHLVDLGPLRPGVVRGARLGRPGQDLELGDALRALADGRADAVGAGVAAADDDHVLAGGGDGRGRPAEQRLGAGDQEVHGEMDAGQVAALDSQVARDRGADRENRGVVVLDQLLGRTSLPTDTPVTNLMPSASRSLTRRSTIDLSSFMFGMPYMSRPPTRSSRSKTVTSWPARLSCAAAARPAGARCRRPRPSFRCGPAAARRRPSLRGRRAR